MKIYHYVLLFSLYLSAAEPKVEPKIIKKSIAKNGTKEKKLVDITLDKIFSTIKHSHNLSLHIDKLQLDTLPEDLLEKILLTSMDMNGNSLLHYVVFKNNLDAFKKVVRLGNFIDDYINIVNNHGSTPLHLAVSFVFRNQPMIEFLVDNNANIHALNDSGKTPLFLAVENNNFPAVEYLLKRGAKLIKDAHNHSMVYTAVSNAQSETVRLLLKFGADPNEEEIVFVKNNNTIAQENKGLPITKALSKEDFQTIKALLEGGAKLPDDILHFAINALKLGNHENDIQIVTLLLNYGASVNYQNARRQTPLHVVVQKDMRHLIKPLIDAGANINTKDDKGRTPLEVSASKKTLDYLRRYLFKSKV